jgi:hypothetical protein
MPALTSDCGPTDGTLATVGRNYGSRRKGTRTYASCWCSARNHILGPFGPDSDLRRWGSGLAARGGKNAKKRAVVAVARKLAVLLHKLWVSGEVYEALHVGKGRQTVEAA